MAGKQKAVFLRFNMEDMEDRDLYQKLEEGAENAASLTAYAKRVLEEYFGLNIKIADRQEFHRQMLEAVREEMQNQGMKLVGALLAGIGTVNVTAVQSQAVAEEAELPETCGELPGELQGILGFIR